MESTELSNLIVLVLLLSLIVGFLYTLSGYKPNKDLAQETGLSEDQLDKLVTKAEEGELTFKHLLEEYGVKNKKIIRKSSNS